MTKLKNIDAIVFDMIGVLFFQKDKYTPGQLVNEVEAAIVTTDDSAFRQKVLKKYNFSDKKFDQILSKIVDKYEPFEELCNLLPKLRGYYKLAVINNGTALTLDRFSRLLNFDRFFDVFISSAREGMKKPDPEIFLKTSQRLQVAPDRCLFMDDSKKNIQGAKKVGMHTIWWEDGKSGFKKFIDLIGA